MPTPSWPALDPSDPLLQLHAELPTILSTAAHAHIWGIDLLSTTPPAFSTLIVLQKYLRSNGGDVGLAKAKLTETLAWRKAFGLDRGGRLEGEDDAKFDGLGFVTSVSRNGRERVVTWNVYGAVEKPAETFADLDRFLRWRVALMERGVLALSLATATLPIPSSALEGPDPHQMCQVHDYRGVSFLKMDPATKTATKRTIALLSAHYPELLDQKFFVNVPWVMSWIYTAAKMIVRKETAAKFVVLAEGRMLASLLGDSGDVPMVYGGTGRDLGEVQVMVGKEAAPEVEKEPVGSAVEARAGGVVA